MRIYLPGSKLVEDKNLATRVHVLPLLHSPLDDLPRGQPRLVQVVEPLQKLFAGQLTRLREPVVEDLVIGILVPARVQAADARADVGAGTVQRGFGRDVLSDAVVDAVERLDKVRVHLEPERVDDGRVDGLFDHGRDDLLAEMPAKRFGEMSRSVFPLPGNCTGSLVHETGTRELGLEAMAKDLVEAALVVIEPQLFGVVLSSDVDDDGRLGPVLGVARSHELGVRVPREQFEEEDGERFVGVNFFAREETGSVPSSTGRGTREQGHVLTGSRVRLQDGVRLCLLGVGLFNRSRRRHGKRSRGGTEEDRGGGGSKRCSRGTVESREQLGIGLRGSKQRERVGAFGALFLVSLLPTKLDTVLDTPALDLTSNSAARTPTFESA